MMALNLVFPETSTLPMRGGTGSADPEAASIQQ